MTMYAKVDPLTKAVDAGSVSPETDEHRVPVVIIGEPPFDRLTQVPVAGPLYLDEESNTVRRAYIVRDMTPKEQAERRGLSALKRLGASDQGMVRSLEDAVLALVDHLKLDREAFLKTLHPKAAERFRDRAKMRKSLNE